MKLQRHFTSPDTPAFDTTDYEKRGCTIRNADGSVVFEMHNIEVPADWSQLASDVLISKYVRKAGVPGDPGHETSVRQVIGRIVGAIRAAGESLGGYFDSEDDAETFAEELTWLLVHQFGAFNSPVWFNCGLFEAYGIRGSDGNWHWDPETNEIVSSGGNYEHPQGSACFIQSIQDDLMSIFDLVRNEARIFKYGSGTGSNFSNLRSNREHLSGGGTSSGLMSFLEVFDRAAGATKSGGTTRRAAKMVCLDADHPEIREFVNWKRKEERKARALIEAGYPSDFNGEAYHTISGQNSNNSVRVSDEFMAAAENGGKWATRYRTTGEVCEEISAADLMNDISESAWECADPGLQFHTTINKWHTCPESGPIRASNPCSEYMFVDDSACNLSSLNLIKFLDADGNFDIDGFRHAVRVFILAQEILVDYSSYPVEPIARNSHLFRPLGIGYANLGSLLMVSGRPYDSDAGRALAGAITALLTGHAYRVSAEIAADKAPFEEFEKNRASMLNVIGMHRDEIGKIDGDLCPGEILEAAREAWDGAFEAGEAHGFRNAQVSVLAPTGTIGLLMDCDTTGVEPDFSLVKFKKLAGGGFFKIVNQSVPRALETLGYQPEQIDGILKYALGTQSLAAAPYINRGTLVGKGWTEADVDCVEKALSGAFDLEQAFSPHVLGDEAMDRLGFRPEHYQKPSFHLLREMSFSPEQIAEANRIVCGTMTVEGAPGFAPEHYAVFDCASKCGALGQRAIEPMGHLRMMAAVQPFLSGAISKTVNLPNGTSVEEIQSIYTDAWRMGLKAVALYRDGCKSSQPLNAKKDSEGTDEGKDGQLELFPELAERGPRRRALPVRRGGITVESRVAGHKVYLRTGEYEDGELGEIFIDMHKEGSSFRSMMMCFAIAVSKGLQYGVPLREFVDTFTFTNFEPKGVCDHPNIKMVNSVIDYVFRVVGLEYQGRTDLCQVKPDETELRQHAITVRSPRLQQGAEPKEEKPQESPAPSTGGGGGNSDEVDTTASALDRQMHTLMSGAPMCEICGHVTVRNGACFKCLNCGNAIGCS